MSQLHSEDLSATSLSHSSFDPCQHLSRTLFDKSPQASCTKSHFCFPTEVIPHTLLFLYWKKRWQKAKAISLHLMILCLSFISYLCCFPTKLTNPCLILIFSKLLSCFPSCALTSSMPRSFWTPSSDIISGFWTMLVFFPQQSPLPHWLLFIHSYILLTDGRHWLCAPNTISFNLIHLQEFNSFRCAF